ncbi:FIST signal transduction protein [Aureibacter tunicatorum]|uniref:FIST domain-containing protein n=1 Tax=Aureibacter tunicatorum TaxID=866807 RepID=A0AAE3XIA4_9BACT|nr:FIST N-terminal domain-containing protein [Aureibacter tunicatorum]MDR6238221.1 hypothetical protein [Aureibacter tunicatorum]BDD03254.1 hypothetical protein AUTU_07370 [Aureibacter tunicatorum]
MSYQVLFSQKTNAKEAVEELKQQKQTNETALVLYFASPKHYELNSLASEMQSAFAPAIVIGSTSAGEILSGQMTHDSIVAMCFDKKQIGNVKVQLLENISKGGRIVKDAFKNFETHFNIKMREMSHEDYLGMLMIDGLSHKEEWLNDQIGNLTKVPFIGGSAADNGEFKETSLFYEGKVYKDTAILMIAKPEVSFKLLKSQGFNVTDKQLTPTKVDEETRRVIEFNNKPAKIAYAEALSISPEEVESAFSKYPLGLIFDEENPFVRSPRSLEGNDIVFFCQVKEGVPLQLLEAKCIVETTQKDLENVEKELGSISAIVNFNCILRAKQLEKENITDKYAELFKDTPTIGFNTYGESFIGHMNQTSTMLIMN